MDRTENPLENQGRVALRISKGIKEFVAKDRTLGLSYSTLLKNVHAKQEELPDITDQHLDSCDLMDYINSLQLTDFERMVIQCKIDNRSNAEIAEITGYNRNQIAQCLKDLKGKLNESELQKL